MHFFRKTNIDFLGNRKTWYKASLAVIVIGIISLATKGIDFGIDFLGGTELIVKFEKAPDVSEIRTMMNRIGFVNAEIKTYGEPDKILLRTGEQAEGTAIGDRIKAALQETFPNEKPSILEEQKIGPRVGAELRKDALLAVLFSLVAILVYIGFRFKFIYGFGAVAALTHDVLVTVGVLSLLDGITPMTNFEIDQNMIAALLTLVGLSVNDTVVIFDRMRENQKIFKTMDLMTLMNKSINETLSRTIITSGTIFLVTMVLFLLGGEVNRGFAFALTIGIITGTYSSIFVASAVVLDYNNRKQMKKQPKPVVMEKPSYETIDQRS